MVTEVRDGMTVLSMEDRGEWSANSAEWSLWAGSAVARLWGSLDRAPYVKGGVVWLLAIPDTAEGRAVLAERPPLRPY